MYSEYEKLLICTLNNNVNHQATNPKRVRWTRHVARTGEIINAY